MRPHFRLRGALHKSSASALGLLQAFWGRRMEVRLQPRGYATMLALAPSAAFWIDYA